MTDTPASPRYDDRPNRLKQALAWVGIVAGVVFVVAVIFFSGFFLSWSSGGHRGKTFLAGSSGGQQTKGISFTGCGQYIGLGSCSNTQAVVEQVVPISGTLHDLYVHLSAAPGTGVHERWQINVRSGGTSLACNIDGTATTCNNTAVSFPVTAGDTVTLEASETTIGGAAPAAVTWAVQVS